MRHALLETWHAVPSPKIVIALGACAISGGPFRDTTCPGSGSVALPGNLCGSVAAPAQWITIAGSSSSQKGGRRISGRRFHQRALLPPRPKGRTTSGR